MKLLLMLWVMALWVNSGAQFNPNNSRFAAPPNPQTFATNIDAVVGYYAWVLANT